MLIKHIHSRQRGIPHHPTLLPSHTHEFTGSNLQLFSWPRLKLMVCSIFIQYVDCTCPSVNDQINNKSLKLFVIQFPITLVILSFFIIFSLYDIILNEKIFEKIKSDLSAHKYFLVLALCHIQF